MNEAEIVSLLNDAEAADADLLQVIASAECHPYLLEGALNHPALTDETVDMLLVTSSPHVREKLLARTSRPEILRRWARSHVEAERAVVAMNPATPTSALWHLVRDRSPHVRANVVFHPQFPVAHVRDLALHDRDADVRDAAAFALSTATGWMLRAGHRWFESDDQAGNDLG